MMNRSALVVGAKILLMVGWLITHSAAAHSPFGASTTVIVGDEVTVNVTFGIDAVTELLRRSEVSSEVIKQVQFQRVSGFYDGLPLEFAGRLYAVRQGERVIEPTKIRTMSDGLEVMFVISYPRPESGALEFQATYVTHVPGITAGSFVVGDADGRGIMSAMISAVQGVVTVPLPGTNPVLSAAATYVSAVAAATNVPVGPAAIEGSAPRRPGFGEFLRLGIEHILHGFDHLLFLVALLVGVRSLKSMLVIITCFTLAHSVTLALAALDVVTLSSRLVEPVIAASIIVVGVENLVRRDIAGDRYWLASAFGLLHGFGFAGALRESGLGQTGAEIAAPLLAFNLGVELGQLAVAAAVVPVLLWLRRWPRFDARMVQVVSVGVILISAYWFAQRVFFVG